MSNLTQAFDSQSSAGSLRDIPSSVYYQIMHRVFLFSSKFGFNYIWLCLYYSLFLYSFQSNLPAQLQIIAKFHYKGLSH